MLSIKYNDGYIAKCVCDTCIWRKNLTNGYKCEQVNDRIFGDDYILDENLFRVAHDQNFSKDDLIKIKKDFEHAALIFSDKFRTEFTTDVKENLINLIKQDEKIKNKNNKKIKNKSKNKKCK